MNIKFSYIIFLLIAILSLFVPIVNNPHPKVCDNYPDGAGGYYSKCKDEYITMFAKLRLKKEN